MNILESISGASSPAEPESDGASKTATATASSNRDAVDAYFVDLFVRCNNGRATEMYEKMGYSVYRRVVE
jgi:N-terminal acetyltransferase B complex catalytic subunit